VEINYIGAIKKKCDQISSSINYRVLAGRTWLKLFISTIVKKETHAEAQGTQSCFLRRPRLSATHFSHSLSMPLLVSA